MHRTLQQSLKLGWVVIGLLAIMTVAEFIVAISFEDTVMLFTLLLIVGLAKAWLIIQYFMHFGQLWGHIADVWRGTLKDDPVADREED